MVTYIVGGLIVGFALGWGIYWYLQQSDRRRWDGRWLHLEQPPLVTGAVWARVWEHTRPSRADFPPSSPEPPPGGEVVEGEVRELDQPALGDGPNGEAPRSLSALPPAQPAPPEEGAEDETTVAYCPTCHARQPVENARRVTTRSGHTAVRGTCGRCGGELFAFMK